MYIQSIRPILSVEMLHRRVQNIRHLFGIISRNYVANLSGTSKHSCGWYSTGFVPTELPRKLKKFERKPLVRSFNELKREARLRKRERQKAHEVTLQPPENGLVIKELIPVAQKVYAARSILFSCVSKVVKSIAIYSCSLCGEVHVGHPPHKIRTCDVTGSPASKEHGWKRGGMESVLPLVESFHLYDRIGRAVSHNEQLLVDRIPAIVELCVQAGVNIPEYPTRRRTFPVYSVAGRIIDFERRFPKGDFPGKDVNTYGFWENISSKDKMSLDLLSEDIHAVAVRGMEAWEILRSGALRLMEKYVVQTCGYCSEVQVGPKGHKVRNCQAYKHQMRDGQHAWQEATVDDILPPVYVWHVLDPRGDKPLENSLKRYYGRLPAVVETFAQAGAHVSENYASLIREDIAVPEVDEEKWVV
ncbi:hypothetical protein FEM48_Zijuj09G0221300 [Ziziphus jujuba var. spinosa]|uniref:APO domain-containing protein n=1 Tax=Ziziphus jujuba var. spinosa TaxID=714518 RepID=A0A978UVL0_ZIZJJ|nr:hypothetical protein FEM48_Zijuj09G0221300 [Ziziphus jujuba var. spinosa]